MQLNFVLWTWSAKTWAEASQTHFIQATASKQKCWTQAGFEEDWDRVAEPSCRADSRLSFAWGCFRWTKVPPGFQSLRKGKLLSRDLLSDGFWLSHTEPSCAQVREPWPGTAHRTLLPKHYLCPEPCLSSQGTPSPKGGWAVSEHLEEKKMQVAAIYPRASCAPSCVLLQQDWSYLPPLKPQVLEPQGFEKLRC